MYAFQAENTGSDIEEQTKSGDENRLYKMMLWSYVTVLPAAALFFVTATITDSMVLFVYLASYSLSFAVQTFSLYAVRQTIRRNQNLFPYGTGKLENFSAFLDGVLYVPTGLYLAYDALNRLLTPRPVGYALGMIPVIITGVRLVIFYLVCRRMIRETDAPSPILLSYTLSFKLALLSNIGVLFAFIVGWALIYLGLPAIGNCVDPAIGLSLAIYMIFAGTRLVWHNFRSLMDLPLTENEQLCVLKVLSAYYDRYEGVGTIYTRTSGKERFVELELFFSENRTLGDIYMLQKDMEQSLIKKLPGLRFRINPVMSSQKGSMALRNALNEDEKTE